MMNLGFEESFSYLFKERRWLVKFTIIFVINFALVVFSLLANYFTNPTLDRTLTLKELSSLDYSTAIAIAVSTVIVSIIVSVFSAWYTYENTQAAIQKRSTKLIWEYSVVDTFKKIVKFFVVSLIYSVVIILTFLVVIGFPMLLITSMLGVGTTPNSIANAESLTFFLIMALCCFAVIAFLFLGTVFYVITMPAYLRLIATNSFAEAFKLRSNLRITKRYFWHFAFILLLTMVYSGVLGVIVGTASIFTTSLSLINPAVGLGIDILFQIPLTIVMVFFTYYVYTRLLGNLYRGIIEREEDLKFLR